MYAVDCDERPFFFSLGLLLGRYYNWMESHVSTSYLKSLDERLIEGVCALINRYVGVQLTKFRGGYSCPILSYVALLKKKLQVPKIVCCHPGKMNCMWVYIQEIDSEKEIE